MNGYFDPRFKCPFTCVISGGTGSGKTTFVVELLRHEKDMFDKPLERIIYCYGEYLQETFDSVREFRPDLEVIQGLPDIEFDKNINNLVIIDDLMDDGLKSKIVSDLFTRGSHHKNVNVIFITQNIFQNSQFSSSIARNSKYTIIFKNPRDEAQILYLGRQMFARNGRILLDAYKDAVQLPHGYILYDSDQQTPDNLRLRTNVLPFQRPEIVYQPKNG